ncbi:MAG: CRTAC1 family protein [Saprospiraceae bacterium]
MLLSCFLLFIVDALSAQTPFVDITTSSGIQHQFIVYEGMFGGGVCVLDVNNDGWEDLYITGGMADDVLYLNQKNGTFKNIFEGSGLTDTKHFVTQGVVSADVNKDGWVDLYITTITSRDSVKTIPRAMNLFFINNGDNTFRNATADYRLDKMISFSTGASFGDVNADGFPDMYIGNYFHDFQGELKEINDATIVNANRTAFGYLLINHKGKYFSNDFAKYGLTHKGFGFGGVFTDYDNDGDQDLFVNQDFGYKAIPDFLFNNQYPKKKLLDVSEAMNMDLKINSMGTAIGDFDNDGDMDYYITNIRFNYFMVNGGKDKPFQNKAKELGLEYFAISWGANFADFDQDGDVDLFVSNGDLNPNCTPMADFYFKNENGKFLESARAVGLNDYGMGRGSATFDMDNDGDQDIIVVNQKPTLDYPVSSFTRLYRNDSASGNWVKVKLLGHGSESRGLGSRIEIYTHGKKQIREVDGGGSSHISQNSSIVHFGLGNENKIDSIVVKWTSKPSQVIINPAINSLVTIEEMVLPGSPPWMYYLGSLVFVLGFSAYLIRKRAK